MPRPWKTLLPGSGSGSTKEKTPTTPSSFRYDRIASALPYPATRFASGSARPARSWGQDRLDSLTIHHGRHSYISHALACGKTLAEVRNATGHANVSITSAYLHVPSTRGMGRGICSVSHRRAGRRLLDVMGIEQARCRRGRLGSGSRVRNVLNANAHGVVPEDDLSGAGYHSVDGVICRRKDQHVVGMWTSTD